MADTLDLSAIFPGMDPETLRKLMAQFMPSDADKSSARSDALVNGGLALLANSRKGREVEALGNAGLFGTQTYRSSLDEATKRRGAAIAQAGGAFKLGKEISRLDQQNAMLKGDDPNAAPAAAAPPPPVPFPRGGTVADALTGDSMGPSAATPPAIAPAPSGAAAATNSTGNYFMRRARELDVEAPMRLALAADTDPFGKAATILAEASKPHSVGPGHVLMSGSGAIRGTAPNVAPGMEVAPGGVVRPMPGFVDATKQIAGAGEVAKAEQNVIPVTITDPVTNKQTVQQMTQADAAAYLSGKRPAAAPVPTPAPTPQPAAAPSQYRVDPAVQAQRDGVRGAMLADELTKNPNDPALQREIAGLNPAAKAGFDRASNGNGPPAGFGRSDPAAQAAATTQATKQGDTFGALFDTTQKAGMAANQKINNLGRLQTLLTGVDTGKLTPLGTELSAWAQGFGLPVDPKLGNKQAFESVVNQMALEMRNPAGGAGMPGSMSDNDLKFLKSIPPSLSTTPEGRAFIIDTHVKLAERDKEVAKIVRTYAKDHGGQLDSGIYDALDAHAVANPLFTDKDVERVSKLSGTPETSAAPRADGTVSVKATNGKVYSFPDAAHANAFKKKFGGQ